MSLSVRDLLRMTLPLDSHLYQELVYGEPVLEWVGMNIEHTDVRVMV